MTNHYDFGYSEGVADAQEGREPVSKAGKGYPPGLLPADKEAYLAGYTQGFEDWNRDYAELTAPRVLRR